MSLDDDEIIDMDNVNGGDTDTKPELEKELSEVEREISEVTKKIRKLEERKRSLKHKSEVIREKIQKKESDALLDQD